MERPQSSEMPDPADRPARLQLFGEIARGGMGAVLRGRDPDLGREVAVKVLLDGHRSKPDLVRRFVEEAQIGGQLQHPGVVPVYELGTFGDSPPLLRHEAREGTDLRRVAGRTQGAALRLAPTAGHLLAGGADLGVCTRPGGDPPRLEALQRDDWGLRRGAGHGLGPGQGPARGGAADDETAGKLSDHETVIATARSGSETDRSLAGSVMGTPAYMAPEQARGEIERLDERCDVFALASILCEILTGQPAFTGRSAVEVSRIAARADTADAMARLDGCGADIELIALAKDCLAAKPEDRPRDASVIAGRVTAHLACVQARVQAAERKRAVAVARAVEERRRRDSNSAWRPPCWPSPSWAA